MKIDSHQHFWKYTTSAFGWINNEMKVLRRDFLPADLHKELRSTGFDGSIAVQAPQTLEETRWLLELAESNDFIKGVIGWVDLCSPNVENQIAEFSRNKKFVGVRHIVQDELDDQFLLRKEFLRGIETLQQCNKTYDILIYPKHVRTAIRFVRKFPDMRFILDHCAKPFIKKNIISPWKEDIQELAKSLNVYCKVSGMVTEADWKNWKPEDFTPYLDVVFEAFGTERVMIGSDWPVCTIAGNYSNIISIVAEYSQQVSREEQTAIMGGNAQRVYGL